MAQSFQASQRLLGTLILACRYYQSRPTLLSKHFRYHSGFANEGPATTRFSVNFVDGPLENFIAEPSEARTQSSEVPKRLKKKVPSTREAQVTASTTKQDVMKGTGLEDVPGYKHSPAKESKPKKRASTKPRTGREATKSTTQVTGTIPGAEDSEWHETYEDGMEGEIETADEEKEPQRDYPDTRTIQEAGRQPRTQQGENLTKSKTETITTSPRPLSTYKEPWQVQKAVLKTKFAEGWNPRKKLSPDTMEGIRALHAQFPDRYTTPVLAEQFAVSPEAIRRILKSKWTSNLEPGKAAEIRERWARRHDRIWDIKSEIGLRPKRKGAKETEDPDQFEEELRGKQLLEAYRSA